MTPDSPDHGFEILRDELRAGFQGLREEFQRALAATEAGIRQDLAATEARLRQQIADSQVETRRYFGVIAGDLTTKIELVIEGVRGVDERLERFGGEVRGEFDKADRRFLRLEARILGRP